jgi:hypothetical protein
MTPLLFFCTLLVKKIYYQLNSEKKFPIPLFRLGEKPITVFITTFCLDTKSYKKVKAY